MKRCLILPPSEGKREGGKGSWKANDGIFGDQLGVDREVVAEALQSWSYRASASELRKFFGVSGAHLERAVSVARDGFVGAPTLPAMERYSGVVWDHLGLATLDTSCRTWAKRNVLVVSGLHGLIAAGDAIPDYRVKMGARLPKLGSLTAFWRPKLEAVTRDNFVRTEVVDLLPNEHAAAFDASASARTMIKIRFVNQSGVRAAGHAAKATKGLVARELVLHRNDAVRSIISRLEIANAQPVECGQTNPPPARDSELFIKVLG